MSSPRSRRGATGTGGGSESESNGNETSTSQRRRVRSPRTNETSTSKSVEQVPAGAAAALANDELVREFNAQQLDTSSMSAGTWTERTVQLHSAHIVVAHTPDRAFLALLPLRNCGVVRLVDDADVASLRARLALSSGGTGGSSASVGSLKALVADAILIESSSNSSPPVVFKFASEADAVQFVRAVQECCDALWLQRSVAAMPVVQSHHAKSIVQSTIGWPDHLRDTVAGVVLQGTMKRWVVNSSSSSSSSSSSTSGGAWALRRCFLFTDMIVWCVPHANVDRQVFEGMSRLDATCALVADLSVDDLRGVKSKRSTSSLFSAVRKPEPADAFQILSRDLGKVDLPQSWLIDDVVQRRVWMHAISAVLRSFGSFKASKLLGMSEANWATRYGVTHRPPAGSAVAAATAAAAAAAAATVSGGAAMTAVVLSNSSAVPPPPTTMTVQSTPGSAAPSTASSEMALSDRSIESLSSSSTDDLAPPSMSKLVRFFGHTPTAELPRSSQTFAVAVEEPATMKRSTTIRLRRLLHITPEQAPPAAVPTTAATPSVDEPLGDTEKAFVERFVGDARELLATGNALGALQEYGKALKLTRTRNLLCERGHALLRLERVPEAEASFDAVLGSDPAHVQAKFWRSYCRQRAGNVAAALADLSDVVDATQVPPALMAEALLRRATIHLQAEKVSLALVDLTSALLIDDQRPEPLLLRAVAHVVAGDVTRALGDLDATSAILVARIRAASDAAASGGAAESRRQVRARTTGDGDVASGSAAASASSTSLRVPSQRRGSSSANSQVSTDDGSAASSGVAAVVVLPASGSSSSTNSIATNSGASNEPVAPLRRRPGAKSSKRRAASTPDAPVQLSSSGSLRKRVRRRKVPVEEVANLASLQPFTAAELGDERADDGGRQLTDVLFGDCDSVAWRPLCATVPSPPNAIALQVCAWRRALLWMLHLRGLALRRAGRVDAALAATEDGLRLAPLESVARVRLVVSRATCLTRQSAFPLAVDLLNAVSARRERDRTLWYVLGLCHSGMGMVGEAARFFSRALDVEQQDTPTTAPHNSGTDVVRDFNSAAVLLARGRSLVHLRLFMAAADDANAVLALPPDVCTATVKSQALNVRAQAYVRHAEVVGDVQFARNAVADCSTVLTTHQDDVNALYTRAQALMFADDAAAAERDLMLAVSLSKLAQSSVPEALSAMQLADDLRMRGAHPSAIVAAYDTALASDPNFTVAVYRRARTMWNARRAAAAAVDAGAATKLARVVLADLDRCLTMAPAFAPAFVVRSDVKRLLGDADGADADASAAEVFTKRDAAEAEAVLRQMRGGHVERDARRSEQQQQRPLTVSQRSSTSAAPAAPAAPAPAPVPAAPSTVVAPQLTARDVSDAMESQAIAPVKASRAEKQKWRRTRRQRLVSQCLSSTSSDSYALAPAPAATGEVRRHSSLFDIADLVLTLPSDDSNTEGEYGAAPASAPHSPRIGARASMLVRSGGLMSQFSPARVLFDKVRDADDNNNNDDADGSSDSSSSSSSSDNSDSSDSDSDSDSGDGVAKAPKQAISVPVYSARDLKIEERIGDGQFGVVWRAMLQRSGRAVAVKQLRAANEEASTKLMREASRMAAIARHANVVALLGVVQRPPSLISELCSLGSLKSLLAVCDPLTLDDVVSLARDTAAGLRHLHEHKTLHRDIAARNVLLATDEHGRIVAKLADFGLARVLRRESMATGHLGDEGDDAHDSGALVPVKWMSPERLLRSEDGMPSDVYSYGILLFEILTRQSPWSGRRNSVVAQAVMQGRTLKLPPHAPLLAHHVTSRCWLFAASMRETMASICADVNGDWHAVELSALPSSQLAAPSAPPPAAPPLVTSVSMSGSPFIAVTATRPRRGSLGGGSGNVTELTPAFARSTGARGSVCAEDVNEGKTSAGKRRVSMLLGDSADQLAPVASSSGAVYTLRVYVAPAIALAVCRKFVDVAVSNSTTATDLIAACWDAVEKEYELHAPKRVPMGSVQDCCVVVQDAENGRALGTLSPLVQQTVVQFASLLRREHGDQRLHYILRPTDRRLVFDSSIANAFEMGASVAPVTDDF